MKALLPLCVLSATWLAACHSDSKPPATTTADKPATAAPAVADSPDASYRIYRGLLPGTTDSLTLHLVQTPTVGDTEINGTFATYLDARGQPYQLLKRSSAADSLVLEDISYEHLNADRNGPKWQLRQQGTALVGTVAGQPVRLELVLPGGSLAFRVRWFSDSIAAFPGTASTPYAHIGLQALVPAQAPVALTASITARPARRYATHPARHCGGAAVAAVAKAIRQRLPRRCSGPAQR